MKKIIDNKVYDTEKCDLILEYYCPVAYSNILFKNYYNLHRAAIYKTKKGTYLKYIGEPKELLACPKKESLEIISAEEFKPILVELNQIDIYEKEFEILEEG